MTQPPTPERLSQAIVDHGRTYLEEGRAESLYAINCGECESFAHDVIEALGGASDGFEAWWGDQLSVDGQGGGWDVPLVRELFPASLPTHGLSWDDVGDAVPAHCWIVLGGRHYDAECPDGVDNLFELPLVRRVLARKAGTPEDEPPPPSP